jgi:hypothetical protein
VNTAPFFRKVNLTLLSWRKQQLFAQLIKLNKIDTLLTVSGHQSDKKKALERQHSHGITFFWAVGGQHKPSGAFHIRKCPTDPLNSQQQSTSSEVGIKNLSID